MNNLKSAVIDNPLQQEDEKGNSSRIEKVIRGYTRFQIVLAILLLIPTVLEVGSGMFILSFIAAIILVPLFVISVVIEVIIALNIKAVNKNKAKKAQDYLSANTIHNTEISHQEQQIKRTKTSKKEFAILFSLLTIIAVLSIGNCLLPKYSVISEAFSQEATALKNSQYRVTIIKDDPLNGIMTVQLDDDVTFDYVCKVYPFGLDSGYGPFCNYRFPDGSHSMGEYIFQKNYGYIQELLIKYQDTLVVDNAKYIFKIKNQEKMESFFSELMQNADFNKSFKAFNNSNNANFSNSLDYIYIRNVEYKGKMYGGIGLFDWANYMQFKS